MVATGGIEPPTRGFSNRGRWPRAQKSIACSACQIRPQAHADAEERRRRLPLPIVPCENALSARYLRTGGGRQVCLAASANQAAKGVKQLS